MKSSGFTPSETGAPKPPPPNGRGAGYRTAGSGKGRVRLAVNLAPDVAAALKRLARTRGTSITEAVRYAIALWDVLDGEVEDGNLVMVIEGRGDDTRFREVMLR